MIILLSPAKTLDLSDLFPPQESTQPRFTAAAEELQKQLGKLTLAQLKTLLGVSDSIARLNHTRYRDWDSLPSKQCVFAFDGPAYKGLKAESLSSESLQFAQQHLRILCGLYGVLRPLDAIKPYRLDMGKKLGNSKGKNLYEFWKEPLATYLRSEIASEGKEGFVVNCASQEYFKAVAVDELDCPVYNMCFPGPSVFAKQARGAMVRFIVEERILDPEGLKGFRGSSGEYSFNKKQSSETDFVFVRTAPGGPALKGTKRKAGK